MMMEYIVRGSFNGRDKLLHLQDKVINSFRISCDRLEVGTQKYQKLLQYLCDLLQLLQN